MINVALPGGMDSPANPKPITVPFAACNSNPLASALPPEIPIISKPLISPNNLKILCTNIFSIIL